MFSVAAHVQHIHPRARILVHALIRCVFSSTENGEKAEKAEPEPEVKEEEPEEPEERSVKTKVKKDKKCDKEGFKLWNELEVQRIKFMVSADRFVC